MAVVHSPSRAQLCNPRDCSTPGLPVLRHLPELAQTHVHRVGDATRPSHPPSSLLLLPSIFPSNRSFPRSWLFTSGGQQHICINTCMFQNQILMYLLNIIECLFCVKYCTPSTATNKTAQPLGLGHCLVNSSLGPPHLHSPPLLWARSALRGPVFCDTALLPVIPPSQTVKSGAEIHAVSLNPTAAIGQGLIWFFAGGLGGYSP